MIGRSSLTAAVFIMVLTAARGTDEVPTATIPAPSAQPVAADNPAAVQANVDAGGELREAGSPEEAIARYDEALRLDPQDASAYVLRAVAYTRLGHDQEAQQYIDRAVELGFDRGGLESEIEELKNKR